MSPFRLRRRPRPAASRNPADGGRDPDTIVITLDPAFFPGTTELALQGWARRAGVVRRLNYPPLPNAAVVAAAVEQLDAMLLSMAGTKVYVEGWSLGAQIAAAWQRKYGPTSTVDPANVTFVLIGFPENEFGGACAVPSPPRKLFGLIRPKADYGGCGIPADTRYRTFVLSRQYAGWEDCPNVPAPSQLAMKVLDDAYHMDYFTVSLDDPELMAWTRGNITYGLWPTKVPWWAAGKRAEIEASYQRPPYVAGGLAL